LLRSSSTNPTPKQAPNVPEIPEEDDLSSHFDPITTPVSSHTSRVQSWEPADQACESDEEDLEAQHHHHVPTNAFMNIGLQTSIAIALHKLPEGFITYATNHANPSLGFTVFMALFINNITEGFSMALPLYLVAVYGCMFAVTAGIMASVALALFVESLSVNHNTQLCIASALVGMAILGISTALTA
jgi:ZIP family zinc transporter